MQAHDAAPERVAIVAMGESSKEYINIACAGGGLGRFYDEVWAISAMGGVIVHDRAFVMHDLRDLERSAETSEQDREFARWMRLHPGPLYVPEAQPEYPGTVTFPLADVLESMGGFAYFNTSVAYAVGLAVFLKVKHLGIYGCDFTYADNHAAEKGRACCEFLIRAAMDRGIRVALPPTTTLLDCDVPLDQKFYGYPSFPRLPAPMAAWYGIKTPDEALGNAVRPPEEALVG